MKRINIPVAHKNVKLFDLHGWIFPNNDENYILIREQQEPFNYRLYRTDINSGIFLSFENLDEAAEFLQEQFDNKELQQQEESR